MNTNTYFGQSWFSGVGPGAGGCPGHWGRRAGSWHRKSIISLSHASWFSLLKDHQGRWRPWLSQKLDNSSPSSYITSIMLEPTRAYLIPLQ
jgi:hypothetical protein